MKQSPFQQIIESVESLPLEDQEFLIDLLQKRLETQRRKELAEEIETVRKEFSEGNFQLGSVKDFLAELDQE